MTVPAGFVSPIQPLSELSESQGFRPPSNPGHQGVDIAGAESGHTIIAPYDGVVVYVSPGETEGGNVTNINHEGGCQTRYDHQSQFLVTVGQTVKQGDVIGIVGATGDVSGPHLHYELHDPAGNPIDPTPYLLPYNPVPQPTVKEIPVMSLDYIMDSPDGSQKILLSSTFAEGYPASQVTVANGVVTVKAINQNEVDTAVKRRKG